MSVHESITTIPTDLFSEHAHIIELLCHLGVKKFEVAAFAESSVKRVIMPGVEEVMDDSFYGCEEVELVECGKLENVGRIAFSHCRSLGYIDLPSARIVKESAFEYCFNLTDVKFGKYLESIGEKAFSDTALRRITIPLKNGLFPHDDVFMGCERSNEVCLIEDEEDALRETVEGFIFDEWKNDMSKEIDSINQKLPNATAGVPED